MALVKTRHEGNKNVNHTTATLKAGDQWLHEFTADISGFSLRLSVRGSGPLLYRQGGASVEARATDPELPVDPLRKDFLMTDGHFVAMLVKEDGSYTVNYRPLLSTRHERLR